MCGIVGFVGGGDEGVLARMMSALQHRGPDAQGRWCDAESAVYLGHLRLSIVDLSGGAQPMWTADGEIGVTFNGEIYNHLELRAELTARGCRFETDHSDTEVLLHAYREWGDSFVERLNGMWAFAILDRKRRRIFASRDRFGKKPFYYFHEGGVFGFASELPALLAHPAAPRSLSALSLQKYFAYCYIPAPRSIIERVWKLPGGHSLVYDLQSRELTVSKWWEFILEPDPELENADAKRVALLAEELRETLARSVERRLMSDVPLGIFLSGGIDSSAIAALAARKVSAANLHTFSIGFDEPSFDESAFARQMAEHLGTDHHTETCGISAAADLARELVARLDEPSGDSSLLPTYLLSRFTRRSVTVALGGDGGDELFAGYDPFRALSAAERYSRLVPKPVHQAVRQMAGLLPVSHSNLSLDFKVKRTLAGLEYPPHLWNAVWMGAVEPREFGEIFTEPARLEEIYSESIEVWDRCRQTNIVDRSLQWWTNLYLQDGILAKVDRASMLCSLEARSPFLDLEMANLARRIPWQLKFHRGETKWILKEALRPLLPAAIVSRKKKGFGMPVGRWLREGKFTLGEMPAPVRPGFVERKAEEHLAGRMDHRLFLWSAWVLGAWNRARLS